LIFILCFCKNMYMSRPFNTPDVFRAVSDPTRRQMLLLLRKRDLTPTELLQSFQLSPAAISQHLRTLRLAGLVVQSRRGKGRVYRIAPSPLRAISVWLAQALGKAQ
jgi:DNA-binding transcriptional ArsR family regulator